MCSYSWVFAAWVDHFKVEFTPTTAKIGESLDMTIEAVDKNDATVSDYDWTILIFSESDPEAELPSALEDNTYTFKESDQWKVKFENSIIFKTAWTQDIHIYDLNDDSVLWVAEAEISEKSENNTIEISIISPETWITIGENKTSISWMTQKNHKVNIFVNWKIISTTSNNEWVYQKDIENLISWENIIKAEVLDASDKVIWESLEVKIKVNTDSLNIKSIKVSPESVDPEGSYEIEIITNPDLIEVTAIVNDTLTKLTQTKSWIYTAKLVAPKIPWTYKIDTKLKDELGHEKTELWSASIKVNKLPEVELKAADGTGEVCDPNKEYKITWLKLVELKTKSILTWDKINGVDGYNVYKKLENWNFELIEKTVDSKFEFEITWDKIKYDYFAVKAVAKNNCWQVYEWALSDATKVKTWPEVLIIIILSLIIWWFAFSAFKKNA